MELFLDALDVTHKWLPLHNLCALPQWRLARRIKLDLIWPTDAARVAATICRWRHQSEMALLNAQRVRDLRVDLRHLLRGLQLLPQDVHLREGPRQELCQGVGLRTVLHGDIELFGCAHRR